ncbi:MAG: hypothetical protein E7580_04235 [Ruminococcaceae bacterium]|nr:hypothetical protein [Oscillospiraceae bacterium]
MTKDILLEKGYEIPETFAVGSARAEVNPPLGTSLAGHGVENAKSRLSTENWDELMLTCTALSDGEEVALIFTLDCSCIAAHICAPMFKLLEEKFGIPEKNVILQATHTHAGPVMYSRHEVFKKVGEYLDTVYHPALERVAEEAIRDLTPAELLIGKGKTSGLNFVRRYVSREDGSFLGNWPDKGQDPSKIMHESEPDEEMQIIRFVRKGKKDVILVNWQCHPTSSGGSKKTNTSADWPGIVRNTVGEKEDALCVFHQGAAGNLIPYSAIAGEAGFPGDAFREHGELISQTALDILKNKMTPAKAGKLIITKEQFPMKRKEGRDTTIPLTVIGCGDIAFATTPNESFCQNGKQVKEGSPFKMTFFCELTNDDRGYIPAEECFVNGGYEVRICPHGKGAGERIANELIYMLCGNYQNN